MPSLKKTSDTPPPPPGAARDKRHRTEKAPQESAIEEEDEEEKEDGDDDEEGGDENNDDDDDDVPPPLSCPIDPYEPWSGAWESMRISGWTWKKGTGLMMDYYYVRPGRSIKCGVLGRDYYVREEDVRSFASRHYGWVGPTPPDAMEDDRSATDATRAVANVVRRGRSSRKGEEGETLITKEGRTMRVQPPQHPAGTTTKATRAVARSHGGKSVHGEKMTTKTKEAAMQQRTALASIDENGSSGPVEALVAALSASKRAIAEEEATTAEDETRTLDENMVEGSNSPRRVASDLIDATCHEIVLLGWMEGSSDHDDVPNYASYAILARRLDHYMDSLDRCDVEERRAGRGGALLDENSHAWRRLLMAKLLIDVCSRKTYPGVDVRDTRPALIDLPTSWWCNLRSELERLRNGMCRGGRIGGGHDIVVDDRSYECLNCQLEALEALAELRGRLQDASAATLEDDDEMDALVERFVKEYLDTSAALDGRLQMIGMTHYVDLFVPRQTLEVFVGGRIEGDPIASLMDGIDSMIVMRVFPLQNFQVEVLRLLRSWEGAYLARPALFAAGYFIDGGRGRKGQSSFVSARGSKQKQPMRTVQGPRRPPVLASDSDESTSVDDSLAAKKKRKRKKSVPYSNEEKRMLLEGVERFGAGKWAEILAHYNFNNRTNGNLKDLYRTLTKTKRATSC